MAMENRSGPGNNGIVGRKIKKNNFTTLIPISPIFQHSIIPVFQLRSGAKFIAIIIKR
jgi:hypothetical protein